MNVECRLGIEGTPQNRRLLLKPNEFPPAFRTDLDCSKRNAAEEDAGPSARRKQRIRKRYESPGTPGSVMRRTSRYSSSSSSLSRSIFFTTVRTLSRLAAAVLATSLALS